MSELPQTRQSLLIRLRDSSDGAWDEFVEIYARAIYRYARSRGLQDADAWDVTQEVLSAVEKKIDSWNLDPSAGKFRGWLFRVARNVAIDKVVEQSRRIAGSGDSRVARRLAEHPETENLSTQFWNEYRRALIHWAGNQIRSEFKESSWLSFLKTAVEGQKPEDIANELGVSVGSVYASKFRIVNSIRKLVSQFDTDGEIQEELMKEFRQQ